MYTVIFDFFHVDQVDLHLFNFVHPCNKGNTQLCSNVLARREELSYRESVFKILYYKNSHFPVSPLTQGFSKKKCVASAWNTKVAGTISPLEDVR